MHYDGYAFSINGQPTITVVSTGRPAPVNTRISDHDYAQINALYCNGPQGDGRPGGGDDCIDQLENVKFIQVGITKWCLPLP